MFSAATVRLDLKNAHFQTDIKRVGIIVKEKSGKSRSAAALFRAVPDASVVLRILICVILLILARKLSVSSLVSTIIMIVSIIIVGYDLVITAVKAVMSGNYFDVSCLVSLAAIAVFEVGCHTEATVFLILYQALALMLSVLTKHIKQSAAKLVPSENREYVTWLNSSLNDDGSFEGKSYERLSRIVDLSVKILTVCAILYAVFIPMITDMTYLMSIRRGAMILIAVAPISMFVSDPLCRMCGMYLSASCGVFVQNTYAFEKSSSLTSVVFDKENVITGGAPKISAIVSPALDKNDFLMTAAHIACKSDQSISAPILSAYNGIIQTERVTDFEDHLGIGMVARLGGREVVLGTKELLDIRGITLDEEDIRSGYVLYLIIAGKYAGCIIFNENINPYAQRTVTDLRRMGVESFLVSSDSSSICQKTSATIGVKTAYSGCDTMKKLMTLRELKQASQKDDVLMYVSSEHVDYHTDADIDVIVGASADATEDILMSNIGIFGIPVMISASRLAADIRFQNTALTLAVKLILILLALLGWATLWFVVLLDFAAGILGMLNVMRILIPEKE